VVGGANLAQSKAAFTLGFVQRDVIVQTYPRTQTADQFVRAMLATIKQNSGVDLGSLRGSLTALYDGTDQGREAILSQLADNQSLIDAEYNRSFVLTEYFGYLRRDPDPGGFDFWLGQGKRLPAARCEDPARDGLLVYYINGIPAEIQLGYDAYKLRMSTMK
jgi:hypothetical protein